MEKLIRIAENAITSSYKRVFMAEVDRMRGRKFSDNVPTHYTMELGDNGFDKVCYYRFIEDRD